MQTLISQHSFNAPVEVDFGKDRKITSCRVIHAHFFEGKVKYDLEIDLFDPQSNEVVSVTRLYNVDSAFVTALPIPALTKDDLIKMRSELMDILECENYTHAFSVELFTDKGAGLDIDLGINSLRAERLREIILVADKYNCNYDIPTVQTGHLIIQLECPVNGGLLAD